MSYQEDLTIDKYNLDVEWERQASLYEKWARKSAEATAHRDRIKVKVDVVRAEIYAKICRNPVAFMGSEKKPTEEAIRNAIQIDPDFKAVNEEYIDSCEDANIMLGARYAFEQRKDALEYLCKLYFNGYFADPRIPSEEKKEVIKGKEVLARTFIEKELNEELKGVKRPLKRKK